MWPLTLMPSLSIFFLLFGGILVSPTSSGTRTASNYVSLGLTLKLCLTAELVSLNYRLLASPQRAAVGCQRCHPQGGGNRRHNVNVYACRLCTIWFQRPPRANILALRIPLIWSCLLQVHVQISASLPNNFFPFFHYWASNGVCSDAFLPQTLHCHFPTTSFN